MAPPTPGAGSRARLGEDAGRLAARLDALDPVNPGPVPGAAGEAGAVDHLRGRLVAFAEEVAGSAH